MKKAPLALQLYTVRDAMQADFPGTLKKVAELGYKGVELAGAGGYAARDLKRMLDDLGLDVVGSHVGIDMLENDLTAALDYNEELDNRHVVCPYLDEERRRTADDWIRMGELFTRIGGACKARGMVFAYHNHSFEFHRFGDKCGMDLLLDASDPALVRSELDVYWALHGGQNPAEYIRRLGERIVLVHLKDMAPDADRSFAEVGEGIIPWPEVLAACEATDVAAYIVEQDVCKRPPLESAAISLANSRRLGLG